MIDLHNDFLTKLNKNEAINYIDQNKKYLDCLLCPVFTTELKNPKKTIKNAKNLINKYEFCHICIEDVGFLNNFSFLLKVKPRYISLTWNNKNKFASGAYSKGGLTHQGKQLIKFCEKNNILIDVAHLNFKSFLDVMEIIEKPIICSHTGFRDIVNDKRNITKSQIKDIIDVNGIIGVYFVGKYISKGTTSSLDVANNINYFVQNFGLKNLAIGSDFYGTDDLPFDVKNYNDISNIKYALHNLGYAEKDISKIFDINFKLFSYYKY